MSNDRPPSDAAAERANTFPWPPVLLAMALIGAWLLGRLFTLPWPGVDDTASHVVGIALGIVGILLILMAMRALSQHNTTIMPDKATATLVTTGPYAMFRNPIYLGEVLVLLCIADWTRNFWFDRGEVHALPWSARFKTSFMPSLLDLADSSGRST